MDKVKIEDILRLQDFGLERLDEDRAIVGFAARAEARIARWLDFAKGALLLLDGSGRSGVGLFLHLRPWSGGVLRALAPGRWPLRWVPRGRI